jgi:hypothetical protein
MLIEYVIMRALQFRVRRGGTMTNDAHNQEPHKKRNEHPSWYKEGTRCLAQALYLASCPEPVLKAIQIANKVATEPKAENRKRASSVTPHVRPTTTTAHLEHVQRFIEMSDEDQEAILGLFDLLNRQRGTG